MVMSSWWWWWKNCSRSPSHRSTFLSLLRRLLLLCRESSNLFESLILLLFSFFFFHIIPSISSLVWKSSTLSILFFIFFGSFSSNFTKWTHRIRNKDVKWASCPTDVDINTHTMVTTTILKDEMSSNELKLRKLSYLFSEFSEAISNKEFRVTTQRKKEERADEFAPTNLH